MTRERHIRYDDGRRRHEHAKPTSEEAPGSARNPLAEAAGVPEGWEPERAVDDDNTPAATKQPEPEDGDDAEAPGGSLFARMGLKEWLILVALLAVCLYFLFRGYGDLIGWMR